MRRFQTRDGDGLKQVSRGGPGPVIVCFVLVAGCMSSAATAQTGHAFPSSQGRPGQTGQPSQADRPGQTGQLSQADRPGQTGQLSQADRPGQTGQLSQADRPGQTGQLSQADRPSQTGQLSHADRPSQTGQLSQPDDAVLIERGAYLAKAGDCAGCHTAPHGASLAGGLPINSPLGTIYSSNITPDSQTGIGRYTYDDFARALRDGVAPGGKRLYPAMPYASFSRISDDDMRALYAYFMRGVPAIHATPPQTQLPFPFNQRWGLAAWDWMFAGHHRFKPNLAHDAQWNRGAYLVQSLGHCGACHTPRGLAYEERGYDESSSSYLTGGTNDHWFAPNLTGVRASGLGRISAAEIVAFLKTGHAGAPLYGQVFGSMRDVVDDSTQYLTDADAAAIARYLKSLPARDPSGGFDPQSRAAVHTATALHTGEIELPGAGFYQSFCAKCHGSDGKGRDGKFPALAGNPVVLSGNAASVIRIVLEGATPREVPGTPDAQQSDPMPAFAKRLDDREIAHVLTFVRNAWGNAAGPVTTRDVKTTRTAVIKP